MQDIIDKLRIDEHYYGEFGQKFLSNSNISTLFETPDNLYKPVEKTVNMLIGGYFHTLILEPDKIKNFKVIESTTRNTKAYKEMSDGELCLLQSEVDQTLLLKDVLENNNIVRDLIHGSHKDSNIEYEVPAVKEIMGNMWKGKADILNHDERLIIDIKTTSSISSFKSSARRYNYDSQAYLYREFFGYDFLFVVVDKKNHRIKLFDCSEQFYERGHEKVEKATEIYNLYYKNDNFDPKEHIDVETLN